MTDQPRISVIIPTYNRAACLPRAVESVLRQTFEDLELIVVDDCSTDGTLAYLDALADPRLRIVRHERNRGGNAARNSGVAQARAPLLAFQDSDDEWLVTKLERQLGELDAQGEGYGAVYCGKVVYGRTDAAVGPRRAAYVPAVGAPKVSGDLLRTLLDHPLMSTQTLMVEKAIFERAGGFDEELRIGQDWELTLRIARHTHFAFVEEPLVMTFLMPDSVSTVKINAARTRQRILERNIDLISKEPQLHARFLGEIGRVYQRHRRWTDAGRYLRDAVRARPAYLKGWAALALNYGMRLVGRRAD